MKNLLLASFLMLCFNFIVAQDQYKVIEQGDTAYTYVVSTKISKNNTRGDSIKNLSYIDALREVNIDSRQKKRQYLRLYISTHLTLPKLETEQNRLERVFTRDLDTSYFDLRRVQQFLGEWTLRIKTDSTGVVQDRVIVTRANNGNIRIETLENGTSEINPSGTFRGTLRFHLDDWIELNSSIFDEPINLISFTRTGSQPRDNDLAAYESIDANNFIFRQKTVTPIIPE